MDPSVDVVEAQDRAAGRGLAAARLAHQTQGFALAKMSSETDPIDRLGSSPTWWRMIPGVDREMLA